jgi:hypothetical protein
LFFKQLIFSRTYHAERSEASEGEGFIRCFAALSMTRSAEDG